MFTDTIPLRHYCLGICPHHSHTTNGADIIEHVTPPLALSLAAHSNPFNTACNIEKLGIGPEDEANVQQ